MSEHDNIQRFMFEHEAIRGEIAHLTHSYTVILQQHSYPPAIQQLLGETLIAAALLTSTLKFEGTLTIQFHGAGPIQLLVAKCNNNFNIRGLAKFEEHAASHQFQDAFSHGKLVITIAPANDSKPYQSIVPLNGLSISQCLENYFAQSEQLATKIWLAVNSQHASGMLLQLLPTKQLSQREYFWMHAVKIGETITASELFTLDNETILYRLYHQEDLRLYERRLIIFKCTCSIEKMENAILVLGKTEAESLLSTNQTIEVCCEYCNHKYHFDKVDVAAIFKIH